MKIEVKMFASLRQYQDENKNNNFKELSECSTVGQFLQTIGVPAEEAPIVLVNGIRVEHDHVLRDGDIVGLFPLMGGG